MSPEAFLHHAEDLMVNGTEEHHFRAAAHAAYYAVYHLVARFFDLDPSTYAANHGTVKGRLSGLTSQAKVPPYVWRAKADYSTLFDLRRHADYVLDSPFAGDDADDAVELAKGIFAARR